MCGEIEEENRFQADLHQRFLVHARAMLAQRPAGPAGLNAYLDTLFADVLRRCVQDSSAPGEPGMADAYGRLAMQSLVLARLAGFLAGHVALNEDPMRKLLEAMMLGYSEAEMHPPVHEHHHHGDGHSHGHGHGHDHHH